MTLTEKMELLRVSLMSIYTDTPDPVSITLDDGVLMEWGIGGWWLVE